MSNRRRAQDYDAPPYGEPEVIPPDDPLAEDETYQQWIEDRHQETIETQEEPTK